MEIIRYVWKFFNKYAPHQGKKEKERRIKQIKKGILRKENGLIKGE